MGTSSWKQNIHTRKYLQLQSSLSHVSQKSSTDSVYLGRQATVTEAALCSPHTPIRTFPFYFSYLTPFIPFTMQRLSIARTKVGSVSGKVSPISIINNRFFVMGMVFGKIGVEKPEYNVIKSGDGYEVREYSPAVVAEITYDPSEFKGNKDGGFSVLANYIGAFRKPQNAKPEKIAMTAPVFTKEGEKIAMTAPVVTKEGEEGQKTVTMQFVLPSKYKTAAETPRPTDERVVIKEEGGRKYGVIIFNGVATEAVVKEKVEKLRSGLERDGFKVAGEFLLARYNPPWVTLPLFRTNEVMIPVE